MKPIREGISDSIVKNDFLLLVDRCHAAPSHDGFVRNVYPALRALIPHDRFIGGIAMLQTPAVVREVNIGFPSGYGSRQAKGDGKIGSPLIRYWLGNKIPVPVFFDDHNSEILRTADDWNWRDALNKHGIRSLAAHGLTDVGGVAMTYFCFAGAKMERQDLDVLLRLAVPHLHIALMQEHLGSPARNERSSLSIREKDVLKLVCNGKTNNEIASILGISGWTVKIHVRNFMLKLDVVTRAQAVAKAMTYGLVS